VYIGVYIYIIYVPKSGARVKRNIIFVPIRRLFMPFSLQEHISIFSLSVARDINNSPSRNVYIQVLSSSACGSTHVDILYVWLYIRIIIIIIIIIISSVLDFYFYFPSAIVIRVPICVYPRPRWFPAIAVYDLCVLLHIW